MTYDKAKILAGIIVRVKLGVASWEEREVLENWLDEGEENLHLYKKIIRGKSIAERFKLEDHIKQTIHFEQACRKIEKRLVKDVSKRKISLRVIIFSGVVAACLCGIIVMLYPLERDSSPVVSEYQPAEVEAKRDKVVLVLEDGEQIGLDRRVPGRIELSQATVIGEKGRLSYEVNTDSLPRKEIMHRVYTTVGGDYSLILSDGTRVWLNAETELKYPVLFIGEKRVVKLDGEAYFEVFSDSTKPFIVETSEMQIRVLGTSFNTSAYQNEQEISTTLLTGRVEVSLKDRKQGIPPVVLEPGMQSQWRKDAKEFRMKRVKVEDAIAWRYGEFVFDEKDIEVVIRMLSRWYDVRFVFDEKSIGQHTFSGKMSKDESLESILKMLTLAGGPEFKIEKEVVYIVEKR